MALPMTVEQDVHDLRERMKYIEGWKDGEAERYGRLERDVAAIKTEIVNSREAVQAEIRDLRASNDRRFDAMQADIVDLRGSMDRRFDAIELRFATMEARTDARFDLIDRRFEHMDKRYEHMDKRFEHMDKRFEHMDKRFDRVTWLLVATLATMLAQIVATTIAK